MSKTSEQLYPAIIHQEKERYWVEFPDLPGCHTYGGTLPETIDNAKEALELYLESSPTKGDIKSFKFDDTIIQKERSWYVATDLPSGLASQGKTIEECVSNIKEALLLYNTPIIGEANCNM